MSKYVKTTDNSIGGMLIDNERMVTATIENGKKVYEILTVTKDQLDNILPIASQIVKDLIGFFNDLFQPFPEVIKIGEERFILTEQRAAWAAIDRVFYMNVNDNNIHLYGHEAKTMPLAKRELRQELKELGYMK